MALLKNSFREEDAEDISFEPVPAGNYQAQIVASDLKVTSTGTGEYISLTFEILDDEYAGRKIFCNLNIVNPNEQAVKIAKSQLKQICKAAGIEELEDTQELHGIPMRLAVKVRPPKNGYDAQNVVNKVFSMDDDGESPWEE